MNDKKHWPWGRAQGVLGMSEEGHREHLRKTRGNCGTHLRERKPGDVTLQTASFRQLRAWLKKARSSGGVYSPTDGYRDFTVGQITAAIHARRKG